MMQKINLLNKQIFEYSEELEKAFCEDTRYFPARINFYIQKTAHSLKQAKEEIEETREKIILNYGKYDAETGYCEVLPQNIKIVNKEISDLMNLEQEISLYTLPLSWLDEMEFSIPQINALMFMIKDDIGDDDIDFIEKEEDYYE